MKTLEGAFRNAVKVVYKKGLRKANSPVIAKYVGDKLMQKDGLKQTKKVK